VHPYAGDVWATWNHRTQEKSKESALTACTQAIGSGCQIVVNGWNVSVAIARDRRDNMVLYGWGDNPDNAQSNVLKVCKDKNYDCGIVNIFTSEPLIQPANFTPIQQQFLETNPALDFSKNYFPDRSVLRVKPVSTSKSKEQKQ